MLELVIIACLSGECREFSRLYDPYEVSLTTCVVAGQAEVADWQEEHPGWRVQAWSCGYSDSREVHL